MKKNSKVKAKLTHLDLEILTEALVESERVVHICGDDKYIERYYHIRGFLEEQKLRLDNKEYKKGRCGLLLLKLRFGLWG